MKNFIRILTLLSLMFLGSAGENTAQQPAETIRFGIIADIQYGDCEPAGSRYYRNSLEKLENCVTELNQQKVDFTVTLGDLTDRNPSDLSPVLSRLEKLHTPCYHITGNHDYKGITENKVLYQKLGMPAEFYSIRVAGWRFIMLNTNEIASYSNIKGSRREKELIEMQNEIRARKGKNAQGYNGGISKRQLEWLKKEMHTAQKKGEKVLIFSHHPLYPSTTFSVLNNQEILNVINTFSCVKCVISGHHHSGAFAWHNNIPYITTEGMIETTDQNAYGIVEINAEALILTGYGRTKSYTIPLE